MMATTKRQPKYTEATEADLPTELRQLYAQRELTVVRVRHGADRKVWLVTSNTGLTTEWTWQGHQGQPWIARVKK